LPLDIDTLSKALNLGGGGFIALIISKKWFVPGWVAEQEKTRADKYEKLYFDLLNELRSTAQRIERA
jgi:hypothetical protein